MIKRADLRPYVHKWVAGGPTLQCPGTPVMEFPSESSRGHRRSWPHCPGLTHCTAQNHEEGLPLAHNSQLCVCVCVCVCVFGCCVCVCSVVGIIVHLLV